MAIEYRKLWLTNSLGQRYDFTSLNSKMFLNAPSGFGFVRDYSSFQIGQNEIVTSQQFSLTNIEGELLFYNDRVGQIYEDYQNFIQFIKFKPLELHYQTPNVQEQDSWYTNVLITRLVKSEVNKDDRMLHVDITLHRLTQWLTYKDTVITLTNSVEESGKFYDLERPYHYAGTTLQNTPIYNNGTDDVGFILRIEGEVVNPTFSLTQDGDIYGICKINGTYDYVLIDSVELVDSLYLEHDGSTITNPEQYQDFTIANGASYLTWCKFRVGESIFNFTCGNIDTFDGVITISFKNSYVSM